MNLGDIDFGLENWPTDTQIENEMDTNKSIYVVVHPIMSLDILYLHTLTSSNCRLSGCTMTAEE